MPQQRRDLADLLEPLRDDVDRLVARARAFDGAIPPREYDRLEEAWHQICANGRALFRGSRR